MLRLAPLLLLAACALPQEIIDGYPVNVDLDGGVPIMEARATALGGDAGVLRVVLDTAAAVTVLDTGAGGDPSRLLIDLELLRPDQLTARARFTQVAALLAPVGAIGAGQQNDIAGVIGSDVLSRVAVRLDPSHGQLRFFHAIPGSTGAQEESCAAVFDVTLAGRGSYVVQGDTVAFAATRVVLGACLNPDPAPPKSSPPTAVSGADTLLLLSTGVGPTILSRTTYEAARGAGDPAFADLPETTLYLPGDAALLGQTARRGQLHRMALVGATTGRRACEDLRRARGLETCPANAGGCTRDACTDTTCAAATVELGDAVDVIVIEDTDPLLQGLRNELRPAQADIGGLLGMGALRPLIVDVDYPGSRVLARCAAAGASCAAHPRVSGPGDDRLTTLRGVGCY